MVIADGHGIYSIFRLPFILNISSNRMFINSRVAKAIKASASN